MSIVGQTCSSYSSLTREQEDNGFWWAVSHLYHSTYWKILGKGGLQHKHQENIISALQGL